MLPYTFYHGEALTRIAQDSRLWGIKLVLDNNFYEINKDACIDLKHSSKRLSPWGFTFLPKQLKEVNQILEKYPRYYLVLICNDDGICCLDREQASQLLNLDRLSTTQWITVARLSRQKYKVTGFGGKLRTKIGNNEFPEKVLHA